MGFFDGGTDMASGVLRDSRAGSGAYSNLLNSYLSKINAGVQPYLQPGGQGFDPLQMALMKSSLLGHIASQYGGAGANVRNAMLRSGSANGGPVGGDYARGIAGLESARANATASGIGGINLSNLQQALSNRWNALGALHGAGGLAGGALNSYNALTGSALNDYVKAQQTGFGHMLSGGLASGLMGGFGDFLSPLGTKLGNKAAQE